MNEKVLLEFEIYIPLSDNQGNQYPKEWMEEIKHQLIDQFDGLTDLKHRSEGIWRMGGVVFRDEVVIYRVLSKLDGTARDFLKALKVRLEQKLGQEKILVIERDVKVL